METGYLRSRSIIIIQYVFLSTMMKTPSDQ